MQGVIGAGAWSAGARGRCRQATTRPCRLRHGWAKGHDKATVRAWARLCTPGYAQLGQVGCFVHSDSVFDLV